MGFKKCPKCDLNYIRDNEQLCKVCQRAGTEPVLDSDDVIVYCIECGDRPAVAGTELCSLCRKEKQKIQLLTAPDVPLAPIIDSIVLPDVDIEDLELPIDDSIPVDEIIDGDDLFKEESEVENCGIMTGREPDSE
ncbi:MAG: hypothetical protein Q4B99_03265 [Clostridia bacterium]|nr:hypothetical protein [Clostridia bacterium]